MKMRNHGHIIHKHQRGFTLLEVFIAIVIGLILMAGVLEIFLHSKTTYNLSSSLSQLQENGRFIENYLVRIVRLAGYRTTPPVSNEFTPMNNLFTSANPYITGTHGAGVNGSDTLTVRYQGSGNGAGTPDGTVLDCLNVAVDANTIATNTFSLTNNNELQCQAQNPNSPTPDNTQVLISGVENFQVLYGEDLDGDFSADRYVPANYPFINWADIVSVRLCLLMRSDAQSNPFRQQQTFYLIGTSYTPAAADNYLRTPLTFTILLRNMTARAT